MATNTWCSVHCKVRFSPNMPCITLVCKTFIFSWWPSNSFSFCTNSRTCLFGWPHVFSSLFVFGFHSGKHSVPHSTYSQIHLSGGKEKTAASTSFCKREVSYLQVQWVFPQSKSPDMLFWSIYPGFLTLFLPVVLVFCSAVTSSTCPTVGEYIRSWNQTALTFLEE